MKLVLPASRKPVNKYTGISILCSELKSENLLYLIIVDAGADYAKTTYNTGCAVSYVRLSGYVIKVYPLAVLALYDALGTQNHTVGIVLGKCLKDSGDGFDSKLFGSLAAEAGKYLIGVMMVVTVVVTAARAMLIVVMVVMLVAMALLIVIVVVMLVTMALLIVIVVVMLVTMTLLIVVVVMMLVTMALLIVVVMVMLVTMALLVVIVVMMLVAMALLVVVVVVMLVTMALLIAIVVVMLVTMALLVVIVMMMVMMSMLFLKLLDSGVEGILLLHSGEDILSVELVPRSSDDNCVGIVLSDKLYRALYLLALSNVGMREDDAGCVGDLVVIELTKVLHIHLALIYVGNGGEAVKLCISLNGAHRLDNVGELTYSAGLDDNSVGVELVKHLDKSLGKITDERAADTAGVHLGYLNAGILKETAVDTDLAELILDKHELFACVSLFNKLLYKCGLSCAEEAGKNIYFRHFQNLCLEGKPP